MKKLLFSVLFFGLMGITNAQEITEPDFVGESLLIKNDQAAVPLEKQIAQNRTVASTGMILSGIGKVRSQLQIDGCCATVKVNSSDDVKIIIKNVDNLTDPLAIIKIFKFEVKKKFRRAEVASINSFGSSKTNNLDYISFTGKKYGTSSYILTLAKPLAAGEYGITISNPNALDEKQVVVSTFSVQ